MSIDNYVIGVNERSQHPRSFKGDGYSLLEPKDRMKVKENPENVERIVCDYIAGMTDAYATRIYKRIFMPDSGSVFDRL